jgi:hypothetical protein
VSQDVLIELRAWYLAQCDDEWEHAYGINIETLDNPGWSIRIDLVDTPLGDHDHQRLEIQRDRGRLGRSMA